MLCVVVPEVEDGDFSHLKGSALNVHSSVIDLPSVTKYCKVHLYADDTLLFFESSSVQAIEAA